MNVRGDGLGYLFGGITILFWSSTTLVVSQAYEHGALTLQILTLVSLSALLFNGACALLVEGVGGFRMAASDLGRLLLLGLFGIFLYAGAFYWGIQLGGPVYPLLTSYLWPILLVLLSLFRKRCLLRGPAWIGLFLAFGGVALALFAQREGAGDRPSSHLVLGALLGAVAAVAWALFSTYASEMKTRPFASQTIYNAAGLAGYLTVALWTSTDLCASWEVISASLYLGMLVNGLAYTLWLTALRISSPARIAPIAYCCPFLALGLLAAFAGEVIRPFTVAGLAVNIVGVVLATRFSDRWDEGKTGVKT